MPLRDHQPIVLDQWNGLWDRGDVSKTPLDHFAPGSQNVKFVGDSSFATRDGLGANQNVVVPLGDIRRIYNYPTQSANTLIVLTYKDGIGSIYHVVNSTTVQGPILEIEGMTDFAFQPYAGRGYISPFSSFLSGGLWIEKGLQDEFVYVYKGDGTDARKAGGTGLPVGVMEVVVGAAGYTDAGLHVFAVVGETDTGFLSEPVAFDSFTTFPANSVTFTSVPIFTGAEWVKRHIVSTIIIPSYLPSQNRALNYYFVPGATINDNTSSGINNISFYDADLLTDASHLFDNFTEIPAGAVLSMYHNRLVIGTTFTDISLLYVSTKGEPEVINAINGMLIVPLDGNPVTNAQELRDVLYVTKRSRTVSFIDSGEEPSFWPLVIIDNALGTSVHGIATVLDSGSSSVDFLIVCTYQGIMLFNGKYSTPELSIKVENYWKQLDRREFRRIQIVNAPIQKEIYTILPSGFVLVGNYGNGLDPKNMRWIPWIFATHMVTVAIANIDNIIFGADF